MTVIFQISTVFLIKYIGLGELKETFKNFQKTCVYHFVNNLNSYVDRLTFLHLTELFF